MMHAGAVDPAKAAEAFASLARSSAGQGPGGVLTVGERTVELTAGEAVLLNALQSSGGRFGIPSKPDGSGA